MKRLALAAVAVIALASMSLTATAAQTPTTRQSIQAPKPPLSCMAESFARFSRKVWAPRLWERGTPRAATVAAAHKRFGCAVSNLDRKAMKETWHSDRRSYGRYRAFRLIAPYPGGGTYWAIPYYIVSCESGGDWMAANPSGAVGPYQLLGWGAPYPATTWEAKIANHRIAADVYAGGAGASNWVCA